MEANLVRQHLHKHKAKHVGSSIQLSEQRLKSNCHIPVCIAANSTPTKKRSRSRYVSLSPSELITGTVRCWAEGIEKLMRTNKPQVASHSHNHDFADDVQTSSMCFGFRHHLHSERHHCHRNCAYCAPPARPVQHVVVEKKRYHGSGYRPYYGGVYGGGMNGRKW